MATTVTENVDLMSWALDNWAQGAVVVVAGGLLGLLIRVHGVATATFDNTRDRLLSELTRIETRNARLDDELDSMRNDEHSWWRERMQFERTIAEHERTIATLRIELDLVRAEVRMLRTATNNREGSP